jgi:NTE family protein
VARAETEDRDERMSPAPADAVPRLSAVGLFEDLDWSTLAAIQGELHWLTLPGGAALFYEGEPSTSLYVVTSGCLGIMIEGGEGGPRMIGQIRAGETVGEMGLISGDPRSATAIALRDTELLALDKDCYEGLVARHPGLMRHLLTLLVRRLQRTTHATTQAQMPKAVAVFPVTGDPRCEEVLHGLAAALSNDGLRVKIVGRDLSDQPTAWFHTIEAAHDLVFYHAEAHASPWTKLCLRQADRVLCVASEPSDTPPRISYRPLAKSESCVSTDLVFLHRGASVDAATARPWLDGVAADLHCNIRLGNSGDLARLARLLIGRAIGLVLSGGAARGFAHLGVIRALRQSAVPIDLIGGASMGAIVAAGVALEWDDAELRARLRRAFVEKNPINDYTLPLLALTRGDKVTRLLQEHFGEARIENLWRPYFCVSSNLTAGSAMTHLKGPLWRAIRASIAIPGILPPAIEGEDVLVDVGVINNFPVDVMSGLRRGPIIGVDVATKAAPMLTATSLGHGSLRSLLRHGFRGPPGIISVLMRSGMVSSDVQTTAYRKRVDLLLDPPIETIDFLDWQAFDRAIEAGYRTTMEALDRQERSLVR